MWWFVFRRFRAIYCLSIPFYVYAIAFFFIGLPSFSPFSNGRKWINNVGTGFYAVASSSGSLFFALNFADEGASPLVLGNVGGAPVTAWVFRACIIQGSQQIFAAGLWYWGHSLAALSAAGMLEPVDLVTSTTVTAITWSLAGVLICIGISLFAGLPDYYRQLPGRIPAFYKSLTRRNIVLVFPPSS
jgi:alpha-1,3-glucan synthase